MSRGCYAVLAIGSLETVVIVAFVTSGSNFFQGNLHGSYVVLPDIVLEDPAFLEIVLHEAVPGNLASPRRLLPGQHAHQADDFREIFLSALPVRLSPVQVPAHDFHERLVTDIASVHDFLGGPD